MIAIRNYALSFATILAIFAPTAFADSVRGKIVQTQGHQSPSCRTVALKRNDNGALMYFRIPATGVEDGILSVTITALTTGLDAQIDYTPGTTTGCGTEPAIQIITLFAPGS